MINIIKFEMNHLKGFDYSDLPSLKEDMQYNIESPNRTAFSLFVGNKLLCIAGVSDFRPGVGEVWIIRGKLVPSYKTLFFKTVYRLIHGYLMKGLGYHRVEMAVSVNWKQGPKWATKLGFEYMGLSKAYDLTYTDHNIYQLVRI